MAQSVNGMNASLGAIAHLSDSRSREAQSFRGLIIGVALGAMLWAPLGIIAVRLF